jgi:3-deoxy-D-manno-octulosonic-acid transferase
MPSPEPATHLPSDVRRSLFVYNLLFPFALLIMLPGLLGRMLRRGGFKAKFGQRLGRYSASDQARFASREWIWIQSISVGETFIALKLARALHQRDPTIGILLSTTTSTGFAEASKAASDWLEPIYNPVDSRSIVRRALNALRPRRLIVIEGGVWPNLLSACLHRGIPVFLVNARLSPRSERRFRRYRAWTGPIFRMLSRITVPEPEDFTRWQSFGVDASAIVCTGNIKFDNPLGAASREREFRGLLERLRVGPQAPILVAGSTWAPEERVLSQIYRDLRKTFPDLFLILVPRHVERAPEIVRTLEPLGLKVATRTELNGHPPQPADVLLINTTGELRDWYAVATIVFIGKSLPGVREIGGQNPAEPAALGRPIIFGPHMENFAALTRLLLARSAALQLHDQSTLAQQIERLLRDPDFRADLGNRARSALASHDGAVDRTCLALEAH